MLQVLEEFLKNPVWAGIQGITGIISLLLFIIVEISRTQSFDHSVTESTYSIDKSLHSYEDTFGKSAYLKSILSGLLGGFIGGLIVGAIVAITVTGFAGFYGGTTIFSIIGAIFGAWGGKARIASLRELALLVKSDPASFIIEEELVDDVAGGVVLKSVLGALVGAIFAAIIGAVGGALLGWEKSMLDQAITGASLLSIGGAAVGIGLGARVGANNPSEGLDRIIGKFLYGLILGGLVGFCIGALIGGISGLIAMDMAGISVRVQYGAVGCTVIGALVLALIRTREIFSDND